MAMLLIIASGCRNTSFIQPGDTLEVAFEKALALYEDEKWDEAAGAFSSVLTLGRGSNVAQEAQFYLAEANFKNKRYLVAASEYERFTLLYPDSPKREMADLNIARCYYELSPRFKLDQTYTRQAIENFNIFLSRYPNSEHREEVIASIEDMREKLAQKIYSAADFYRRTQRYEAAVLTYGEVIDQYPETAWAEQSLVEQMESYILYADNSVADRQQERYREALEVYDTYLQLFPRGESRTEIEDLFDEAEAALASLSNDSPTASR
ncbi:MAG: outer membrane protein assembly factor BamD [Balneolaceae bacterium]|nr:outer membrane protein assembly factor BamD [Balneolaceae bacterium]MDR9446147.1 outer membrane protein assembly factor BamD [Balneolaceae bacterium]